MNIKKWITENIPRTGIILEAGSADGNDSVFFCNHCSEGKVYSFEPYPNYFEMTKNKVGNRSNFEISPLALSDKTGKATFWMSDLNGGDWGSSSILEPKEHLGFHPAITFKSTMNVKTINLDEWISTKDIPHIDLMWLDMQGAEPIVLMSAPNTLKRTKYLYTEVSFMETYEGVIKYPAFLKFLNSQGFELICEDGFAPDMGNILLRNTKFEACV